MDWKETIAQKIADKINIPLLPEALEKKFILYVLDILVDVLMSELEGSVKKEISRK